MKKDEAQTVRGGIILAMAALFHAARLVRSATAQDAVTSLNDAEGMVKTAEARNLLNFKTLTEDR